MLRLGAFLPAILLLSSVGGCGDCNPLTAGQVGAPGFVFSTAAEFDEGTLTNLVHDGPTGGQLKLSGSTQTFPFIWIALSARGTICKIDTNTGEILGEYRTAPETEGFSNPSRTTVSLNGSAWAGNRAAASVVHVGLIEANQAVDRNGNGVIDTSTGYGDVRPWPNASGVDSDGGVETAEDECILHFVRTSATATRHVTVNADNNVWASGRFGSNDAVFDLIDGETGAILRTEGPFNAGGYGGVIDRNGVLWSASSDGNLLRWDPNAPLSGTNPTYIGVPNYGLAVDGFGNIWVTALSGNLVSKLAPDGTLLGSFQHGSNNAQGLAIDSNNHVWVSSSLVGLDTVGHLLNDGTFLGNVAGVGSGSTGVAIDSNGKIWTANIVASNATRIDPSAGPIGSDGVTPIGAVDLTVDLPGASPYNYSDMTGAVALSTTNPQGTWRVVKNSGAAGTEWTRIVWNTQPEGQEPPGSSITLEARAADTVVALGGKSFLPVSNGVVFSLVGQHIEVRVKLTPNGSGASPVLSDVAVHFRTP